MQFLQTKIFTDERILKIISRIKIVFIIIICLLILNIIHGLLELSEGTKLTNIISEISPLIAFSFLYIGLKYRKKWFIPLVLIVSAILLLNACFRIFQPVADTKQLMAKIGSMAFFMFSLYQLYFFSRREVKMYFGVKDKYFF